MIFHVFSVLDDVDRCEWDLNEEQELRSVEETLSRAAGILHVRQNHRHPKTTRHTQIRPTFNLRLQIRPFCFISLNSFILFVDMDGG